MDPMPPENCPMKKIILLLVAGFAVYALFHQFQDSSPLHFFQKTELSRSDQALQKAFEGNVSDFQVGGSGKVIRVLPDDTEGRRHQKFIIKLKSGQTLLFAHNIDIAPRIQGLKSGDHVNFYGEYEWSPKGGVLHWTHQDPQGHHENGWINHNGKLYE